MVILLATASPTPRAGEQTIKFNFQSGYSSSAADARSGFLQKLITMKPHIIFFLFSLSVSTLPAQTQPVQLWQSVEYVKSINIKGPTIALDKFQNTYMLTNQTDESPFSGFTLVKYDTLGNALWKRHSQISIIGVLYGSFTVDSTGNAYVSQWYDGGLPGYDADALLIRYAPDGTKLWEANYGLGQTGDSYIYYSEMDTLNGRLITLGMNLHDTIPDENFLLVQAVDTSDGSVAWKTKISGVFRPQNLRVQSGHIQLLSTQYKPDSKYFVNTLLDFEGNVTAQYEKPYSGYEVDFNYISKTGDVVFGNRAFGFAVTRVNVEGDTLWRHEYPNWYEKNWVRGIVEDDSLNVYATGSTQLNEQNSCFTVLKLKDGVVLWEKFFQMKPNSFNTGEQLFINDDLLTAIGGSNVTVDSSRIVLKLYNYHSGEELYQIIVEYGKKNIGNQTFAICSKIFYTGIVHENITNTVNIISGVFKLPKISTNVVNQPNISIPSLFPNPATEQVYIYDIDLRMFNRIIVQNMKGEIIMQKKVTNSFDDILLAAFPIGTYVISLQGKGVCISKKIVKI